MKLLVIEDELDLRDSIQKSLMKESFLVEVAGTYEIAYEKISIYEYDCILLDIMLPDGSGLELLHDLKDSGKLGNVIIISAKDSLEDKLLGLDLGADDYLTKPFHIAELTARVKAVLRRNTLQGKNEIEVLNVRMNLDNRQVFVDQKLVSLNRKEFDVLQYFLVNKNRLITRTALAEYVWGDHIDQVDNFDFIYSQIKNIRKKLKGHNALIEIRVVYGLGYKLVET